MNKNFFKLSGDARKINQVELIELLENNEPLENFIFEPDSLTRDQLESNYKIKSKEFSNVSFSRTELKNLIFQDCKFKECLFIGSSLKDCEFHDSRFINCNVHKIEIEGTYVAPESFLKCLDKKKHQNIGVHLFQTLMRNSKLSDQPDFESDARFYFLRWQRYQMQYKANKKNISITKDFSQYIKLQSPIFWNFLFEFFLGSGVKFSRFFITAIFIIIAFWLFNLFGQQQFGLSSPDGKKLNCISAFYYTVISLTTVGYGDIAPTTDYGRLWASFQSIVGFIMFALLASMFFRKIAP